MNKRIVPLLGLWSLSLWSSLAIAEDADRFTKLKASAEPVSGLGVFLDNFVGECSAAAEGGTSCAQKVKEFRQKMRGKKLYMIINEDNAGMLSPGGFDRGRGEATVQVTPFFPANGYALTHGAPKSTDDRGNPVMPLIRVTSKAPDEWTEHDYTRLFSSRALKLQVIFTPQEVWTLPKRGGGKMAGVRAKIEAMLITVGRTGETVGVWLGH